MLIYHNIYASVYKCVFLCGMYACVYVYLSVFRHVYMCVHLYVGTCVHAYRSYMKMFDFLLHQSLPCTLMKEFLIGPAAHSFRARQASRTL